MKHLLEYNIFDVLADEEEKQLAKKRKETQHRIEKLKGKIEYLKTTGDDSYVKQDIMSVRREIAGLKSSLLTDEQKAKKAQRDAKAAEKRHKKQVDQYKIQDKIEKKFQAQLSDRDKAINTLADLQYTLRNSRRYDSKYTKKVRKEFDALKAEHDVKSYEIKKKKLLKLETDILLNINSLSEAVEIYKKLLLFLNTGKPKQSDKRMASKMLEDIRKFYGYAPFNNLLDELFPD